MQQHFFLDGWKGLKLSCIYCFLNSCWGDYPLRPVQGIRRTGRNGKSFQEKNSNTQIYIY